MRESAPLELQRQVPPVDPGHGVAQRLADAFVRWLPDAEGSQPCGESPASEREARSGGPEGRISLAEIPARPAYTRASLVQRCIFQTERCIFQTERGTSIAERCIFLARTRMCETERGTSIAERCILLARTRILRSRAIAVVVDRCVFQAGEDARASRPRVFPARARLSRARSRVSPPGMRIFQAGRCTGTREAYVSSKKAIGPVRNSASD